MDIKQHFRDHLFFYIVLLGIIIMATVSFYRFVIKNDYLVYYEGNCDPYTKSCFEYCDEGECTYYMKAQKRASDVFGQCGKDITDCESANVCLPDDIYCTINYCDTDVEDDCAKPTQVVPTATTSPETTVIIEESE